MTFLPEPETTRWQRIWWRVRRWPVMSTLVWHARNFRFWLWKTLFPQKYQEYQALMAALAASVKAFAPHARTMFTPSPQIAEQFRTGSIGNDNMAIDWYANMDTTMAQNFHKRPFTERLERWLRDW